MFGRTFGFYGVHEIQARGSLHLHLLLYGGINPGLLQKVSHCKELCRYISEALDRMYQAQIPQKAHVLKFIQNNMTSCKHIPPSLQMCPMYSATPHGVSAEFSNRVACCVCHTQFHTHSFTCAKPPQGLYFCRMCYPQGLKSATGPLQLKPLYDGDNQLSGYTIHADDIEPPQLQGDSVVPSDDRIVMWELARPELEGLPKISPALTEPADHAKEMIRIFEDLLEDLLTTDISRWLNNISHEKLEKLYKRLRNDIKGGNGWIVTYNPILTALLGYNMAAYPMGNSEQSNNSLFYLSPYVTKNKVVLNCDASG